MTGRQYRRVRSGETDGRCAPCGYDGERGMPSDSDRRFWLDRLTDQEIAAFSRFAFGRGDPEAVRAWRERLAQ